MSAAQGPAREHSDVIRASEMGRYVYCARAWWIEHVLGLAPQNLAALARGAQRHDAHGRAVSASLWQARIARGLLALAALCALGLVISLWLR
jgi:hypothetical protein